MRTGGKLLAAGGTLAAIVALSPIGAALGRGEANTQVTIQGGGGLVEGEVKSPDEDKCAAGRKVLVFKVKNGESDKVASDTATQNGDRYQWGTDVGGGKFFAKVRPIDGKCQGDTSKTVKGQ